MSEKELLDKWEEEKASGVCNDSDYDYICQQEYLGEDIIDLLEGRYE